MTYIKNEKLLEKLKKFNLKIAEVRNFFVIWKYLETYVNITMIDENDAEKNVELLKRHANFYISVKKALLTAIVLDVTKFYSHSSSDDFRINELLTEIDKYDHSFLKEWKELVKEFHNHIEKIRQVRHELFAHQKIEKEKHLLPSLDKIEQLIEKTQEFLARVSSEAFGHGWIIPEERDLESFQHTELLLENLHRGESARLKEIDIRHSDPHYKKYLS